MTTATFTPVAHRFVWKEYRMLRGFWLAVAGLAIAQQCVSTLLAAPGSNLPAWLFGSALAAAALYAAGAAATSFAVEHEDGTYDYLAGLPTRWQPVLVGKLLVSLISALVLAAVLTLVGFALAGGRWPSPTDAGLAAGMLGMAIVEAVAWGTLFSLLVRRPLVAAMLTLVVGTLAVHLAVNATGQGNVASIELESYTEALSLRIAIVVAVLASSVLLARRWFSILTIWQPATIVPPAAGPAVGPSAAAGPTTSSLGRGLAGLGRRIAAIRRVPRYPMLARLLWQTWRESRAMLLLPPAVTFAVAASVLLVVLPQWESRADEVLIGGVLFAVAFMLPALFGALAFHADQRHRGYRFLAEHAARPRYVWLTRHAVWLGAAAIVLPLVALGVAVLAVDDLRGSSFPWEYPTRQTILYQLQTYVWNIIRGGKLAWLAALAAYAAGQLSSMLLRSGILATVLALVAAAVLAAWTAVLYVWQLSGWWFLAPLVVGMMAATWLRTPAWIADRNSWRAWCGPALFVAAPLVAVALALPAARLAQLPVAKSPAVEQLSPERVEAIERNARVSRELAAHGFPTDRFTPDELETARMYFQMLGIAQSWTERRIDRDDAPADEKAVRDEASRRLQQLRERDPEGAAFIALEGNRRWREHVEAEARETADMYLDVLRRLDGEIDDSPLEPWFEEFPMLKKAGADSSVARTIIPADRWEDFLAAKKEATKLRAQAYRQAVADLIAVSHRPLCQFPVEEYRRFSPEYDRLTRLARSLPIDPPTYNQQLDYALAALRMSGHLREGQPVYAFGIQLGTECQVLASISRWASPARSSDQLRDALKQLQAHYDSWQFRHNASPNQAIWADREIIRNVVEGREMPLILETGPGESVSTPDYLAWLANQLPWERQRALRALDQITRENSGDANDLMSALRHPPDHPLPLRSWVRSSRGRNQPPRWVSLQPAASTSWLVRYEYEARVPIDRLYGTLSVAEMDRRATLLHIALVAYRRDHDRYPRHLADLVPDYFETLPLDPYSGQPFQYAPDGLDLPLLQNRTYYEDAGTIPPHQPLFWSVGPGGAQLTRRDFEYRTTVDGEPTTKWKTLYQLAGGDIYGDTYYADGSWGLVFLLPKTFPPPK